jgi:GNAT superfamily N-acetyltransferase
MHFAAIDASAADDSVLAQIHALNTVVQRELYPDDEPTAFEEFRASVRHQPAHCVTRWWVAFDDDRAVGRASLDFTTAPENRHLADASVHVRPDHRRQGVASRLLAALAGAAQEQGRRLLQMGAMEGRAGEAFLTAIGAEKRFVEHENRLLTEAIDMEMLERWVADAATQAADYSLLVWDGRTPPEHIDAFARLLDVMNDAPRGDLDMEDERNEPDQVEAWETAIEARGQTLWTLVARHDPTGALAGWSTFLFPAVRKEVAYQLGTGVAPGHRGHGLGRWMKATNALRLLAEKPAVRRIETENATTNGPMLAINHEMGFRSHETIGWWEIPAADLARR